MSLDRLAWTRVPAGALLVVPLGATEQHGPHLPLGTDTAIASALCAGLVGAWVGAPIVVAPAVAYGSSGEHGGFAGTLSIGQAGLELVVVELVRSADAFAGTVLVSAHGGNAEPLARAVATLTAEGRRVLAWAPRLPTGDAHAGRTETSLMLAIAPGDVDLEAAAAGDTRPLTTLAPALRAGGVATVSPNGVLGDPGGASAEEGRELLAALTADLLASVRRWAQ